MSSKLSVAGTFRNGERLAAKRVMKLALGETMQVGTVQLKLVRVTALNTALNAALSPTRAQTASNAAAGPQRSSAASQLTLHSATSCGSIPAGSVRQLGAESPSSSPKRAKGVPATAAAEGDTNRQPIHLSPPTPSPAAACSPVVVDLMFSGGGSSSASPLRSQQTTGSSAILPQLPQSKYSRAQLHAVLSPPSPASEAPSKAKGGAVASAAGSPHGSGSTADRLAQLHAALTMQVSSQESSVRVISAPGVGGLAVDSDSSSEGQGSCAAPEGGRPEVDGGVQISEHRKEECASQVHMGVQVVPSSAPGSDDDGVAVAVGGQGGVHSSPEELPSGSEDGSRGGAGESSEGGSTLDARHAVSPQYASPGVALKSSAVAIPLDTSLDSDEDDLPIRLVVARGSPASNGDSQGALVGVAAGGGLLPMQGPGDLWSDASISSAPSLALQQHLLLLGVQPKRRRADNCALLKRVQKLVLQGPPWEVPPSNEGAGGAGGEGGLISAKGITAAMVRDAIVADGPLHELVLVQAPVPLERFVIALSAQVSLKSASSPSVATAVREVLQADGILFTSAWR